MKLYQILLSCSQFASFVLSAIALKMGALPYLTYAIWLPIAGANIILRIIVLKKYIPITISAFGLNVIFPVVIVVVVSLLCSITIKAIVPDSPICTIIVLFVSTISAACASFLIGCTKTEKSFVIQKGKRFIKKIGNE